MIKFAGIKQGLKEIIAVNKVLLSPQHASDKECDKLEREFANFIGTKYALTLNSGSSANLLALKVLNLPKGSKVITSGCGFPATLSPILHLGYEPILVDYDIHTQNIDLDQVEKEAPNAKAILFAHTMGNPVDMDRLMSIAKKYKLKVIEDCCEAVGSKFGGKYVGTFGDISTFSFYPTHQINGLGGGGCLVTNNEKYAIEARSLRNWGKVAKTPYFSKPPKDYTENIDGVKYHEQYTYQTVGFNMLMSDVQAAYLRVQLKRLPKFIKIRERNWNMFKKALGADMIVHEKAEPAYFGFTYIAKDRNKLIQKLEDNGIKTRPFFAGNITRHKPFEQFKRKFKSADYLMEHGLFWGVWQGMTRRDVKIIIKVIKGYNA